MKAKISIKDLQSVDFIWQTEWFSVSHEDLDHINKKLYESNNSQDNTQGVHIEIPEKITISIPYPTLYNGQLVVFVDIKE